MTAESDQWLHLARTDLDTARQLTRDSIYYAAVFFAHQAGEKALKALWIARRGELAPRTHNLVALASELGAADAVIEAAAELSPEYVLTRYITPDLASPEELYDRASANVHTGAAESIIDWAAAQIRRPA